MPKTWACSPNFSRALRAQLFQITRNPLHKILGTPLIMLTKSHYLGSSHITRFLLLNTKHMNVPVHVSQYLAMCPLSELIPPCHLDILAPVTSPTNTPNSTNNSHTLEGTCLCLATQLWYNYIFCKGKCVVFTTKLPTC